MACGTARDFFFATALKISIPLSNQFAELLSFEQVASFLFSTVVLNKTKNVLQNPPL